MFKLGGELVGRGGAAVDQELVVELALLAGGKGPIAEAGDVRVDQALFVHTPGGWVVRVLGMVEDGDAKDIVDERSFDGAPGSAFLLAGASPKGI